MSEGFGQIPVSNRFLADNANDGTPFVLDQARLPAVVVVPCRTDAQAERIAGFLNEEFSSQPPRSGGTAPQSI